MGNLVSVFHTWRSVSALTLCHASGKAQDVSQTKFKLPVILLRVRKVIMSFDGDSVTSSDNGAPNLSASLLRSVTTDNPVPQTIC